MARNQQTFKAFEQTGWERVAKPYDDYFSALTNQTIPELLRLVNTEKDVRLLDIATGPGYVAAQAAHQGAQVVGMDFSRAMVAIAQKKHPSLIFIQGDAEALPFADNSFDAVTINFGILHFEQPEKALKEACRVLRPQGRIAFTVWAKPEEARGFDIVLGAVKKYGTLNVPLPPGPPFFRFSDSEEAKSVLMKTGFSNPTVQTIPMHWKLASPDDLFQAFWKGTGRTGPLLKAQNPEALQNIKKALREAVKDYEKNGGIEIPMAAVLASAGKE